MGGVATDLLLRLAAALPETAQSPDRPGPLAEPGGAVMRSYLARTAIEAAVVLGVLALVLIVVG